MAMPLHTESGACPWHMWSATRHQKEDVLCGHPSMGCGGCLSEKPHAEADVFCGHPSMGSGGGFGGRQQARNGACSLIFTKRKETPVAGIISGATALKIHTACRRDAFFSPSAVVSALKYRKYLECTGSRRSGPKLCFRLCFRPLSDRRWSLFHCLSRALPKSPFSL